jgi:hypothetical protein
MVTVKMKFESSFSERIVSHPQSLVYLNELKMWLITEIILIFLHRKTVNDYYHYHFCLVRHKNGEYKTTIGYK